MGRLTPQQTQAGFTLVELLVAMVIGLLVMGGATQLFISSQQSYRFQTALADMQDTGRFALDTMARELRQADYSGGCTPPQTTVHLRPWADSNEDVLPLQAWNTPSNHDFSASLMNPVAGQDVLAFRGGLIARTGFTSDSLNVTSVDNNQQITLSRDMAGVFNNRLVLLQGLQNCDIFYNTSNSARTLQKTATAGWQGNVDPGDSEQGGENDIIYSPGQNVSLSALNSAIYYIGQDANNDNAPSLMRLDLSQTAPRNDIVASHVVAMRTAFLIDDAYVPADEVDAAEWPNVQALRITLIVQSDRPNLRNANTTLALGNFRGENAFTGGDGRIYQAFTTTVALRNR
ncbi:PilW family protein [Vreelandella lutescens]|uniref:Type IV pilin n=1 Tax=Vreelandella lutescens TaxID=1602943 RepID=A0ABQ1P8S5_9GAMM|nr:PilW family protein [Halomonas lutescens]GGC93063.1 type IV pilin [Halomonas lutescens]